MLLEFIWRDKISEWPILKKNKFRGLTLPNFKTNYKATVIRQYDIFVGTSRLMKQNGELKNILTWIQSTNLWKSNRSDIMEQWQSRQQMVLEHLDIHCKKLNLDIELIPPHNNQHRIDGRPKFKMKNYETLNDNRGEKI